LLFYFKNSQKRNNHWKYFLKNCPKETIAQIAKLIKSGHPSVEALWTDRQLYFQFETVTNGKMATNQKDHFLIENYDPLDFSFCQSVNAG
jgi:hypothetical protein